MTGVPLVCPLLQEEEDRRQEVTITPTTCTRLTPRLVTFTQSREVYRSLSSLNINDNYG